MRVSINGGYPKSSMFKGFSMINHQFWGIPIYGRLHTNELIRLGVKPFTSVAPSKVPIPWLTAIQLWQFITRWCPASY